MEKNQQLEAKYGLFTAISMVVGQVIGSGIFFKVDDVLVATQGNIFAGFLGWLIVGLSVVFGAISLSNYAELIPKDGGILSYVEYRFGKKIAVLVGWMYLSMFYPLLTAVVFTVSGIYISHLIAEFTNLTPGPIHFLLIGIVNALIFFCVNIFKPKASGIFQQMTTVLKLIPLIFISGIGIISFVGGNIEETNTYSYSLQNIPENQSFLLLVAASFIPIAFALDGWYIATQISGEIKNSKKNLPKALVIGTITVLIVYLLYYSGIVFKMSSQEILTLKDTYITEFSRKIASDVGAFIIQIFIIISVLGTANGLLMATVRVPYQFSNLEKSKKFLNLNIINEKTKMPVNSAILGLVLVILYIVAYYFTNTREFFSSRNFDLSAVPIVFIYMVNGSLFIGLLSLIKNKVFSGNALSKYIMAIIAILGVLVVLIGTATAPNGITYILISLIFLILGLMVIKK